MKRRSGLRSRQLYVAAGAVVLGAALPAAAANLLANPGFEVPTDDPGDTSSNCQFWDFGGTDMQRATFQNHTTPDGRWCAWAKTFEPIGGSITQKVAVTAGANYTLTSQLYFEINYPGSAATTQLGLIWLNASNNPVGTPNFTNIDPTSVSTIGSWTPYMVSGVAPVGATQVQVFLGWTGGTPMVGQEGAFFDDADLEGVGSPPTTTWAKNGSGDWNSFQNWASLTVPNGTDAQAQFLGIISSPQTVYTNTAVTVGTMRFNNPNTYVVTGAGSLTMDVSTGNALIEVGDASLLTAQTQKINLPLFLNDNTTANVFANATLTIADPLTLASGTTLTKTGAGAMDIISLVSTGGPAALAAQGGTTNAYFDLGANTTVTASGGTTNFRATQHLASVSVGSGAAVNLTAGANKVLVTKSLAITGTGKVDLADNDAVIDYTGPIGTKLTDVRNQIKNGQLITSSGTATTRLGYADNAVLHKSNFSGEPVDSSSILIKYTYAGDSDLDGDADGVDIGTWATNFTGELGGTGSSVWTQGDWDYDGDVDGVDAGLWAQAFTGELGGNGLGSVVVDDPNIAAGAAAILRGMGITVVPEPASLAVFGAGLLGLQIGRRRRG